MKPDSLIYKFPEESEPIRQGDIFYPLPKTVLNLEGLLVMSQTGERQKECWASIYEEKPDATILTKLRPVWGIVATQDCDAAREDSKKEPMVSFFEIGPFESICLDQMPTKNVEEKFPVWIGPVCHRNLKWFYLPPDSKIGFLNRMAIDFHHVFQLRLSDLSKNIGVLRKGRLNKMAYEHYRECIAQYFRRYPYDEWYPLNKDEFIIYNKNRGGNIPPFDWQM
jgi:hypothetical protein